jgi:ribonucleoside-diphosphate reductase alpha subunit
MELRVTKRNLTLEIVSFDKILKRLKTLGEDGGLEIPYTTLVMKIIDQIYDLIPTKKIDELTAEQCAAMSSQHTDYGILASRIVISNHHKNNKHTFSEGIQKLFDYNSEMIDLSLKTFILENAETINRTICSDRDYLIDYFGFKTLEKAYLLRTNDQIIETPQHMWMRVALAIHYPNLEAAFETYHLMSQKYFTHATPTLFNAGSTHQQLSSCFLVAMEQDSIDGIYKTLLDCARISKWSGGIGLHIHNIRSKSAHIKSTNGHSFGIVPMLRLFNDTAKFVNQGGKRNGSFAIYLETWHADIEDFLNLKKNHGDEEMRARDLFYGLWISDLFMERVEHDKKWSLFCPSICPNLSDVYGVEFNDLYKSYETMGLFKKQVSARSLWFQILDAQMETGNPYLLYKDSVNEKSNQKNLGTIKSSNLCCEVTLYTDENETAVCNLASIALPSFIKNGEFDYKHLHYVTKIVTANLNRIIDINFYPTEKAKRSNLLHRPIGIGVQGLADTFIMLNLAYDSDEAKKINYLIFETMYHAALEKSNELARNHQPCIQEELDACDPQLLNNGSYSSFKGSPASQGILQYDMWNKTEYVEAYSRYNWSELKEKIKKYGLRNSTLLAPMPTASTSQILGFNECFEPLTSNIYSRQTLAGDFMVTNKYLMKEMSDLKLWNDKVKNNIVENKGSVQNIIGINHKKYKTVWELSMRQLIDMSADRGIFICQSQSLNLWIEDPNYKNLTSMHFYAWKKGLKTGIYYLRRKAKHQPQQFTIEPKQACETCTA